MSENFQFLGKIGQGAFATVYKVKRHKDSSYYAFKKMKTMKITERQLNNTLNQIRILASINNPYIIEYKQAFYDSNIKSFCLVTQYAQGGDLLAKLQKAKKNRQSLPQAYIWKTALQLLHGVKALHSMKIFHRDIKPANILLSKNQQCAKLADMNVSVISKTGLAVTQTGTPSYASPQVWMEKPYSGKSDIWSLGCVIYQMATLKPPFMATDLNSLKRKIVECNIDSIPSSYSKQLQAFIKICLQKDQKIRPSATDILNLPQIKQKMKQFPNEKFNQIGLPNVQKSYNMVNTIRIDNGNFKSLHKQLPKSNYNMNNDKQNQNNLNKIEENVSCLPKVSSKQQTKDVTEKLPAIKRCNSEQRREVKLSNKQVLKKIRY